MSEATEWFQGPAQTGEWQRFAADGFNESVTGIVFRTGTGTAPCCGVPLGGLGTGCIDIDTTGVLGFSSVFQADKWSPNPRYQPTWRHPALQLPFLGVSVDSDVWVLATDPFIKGGKLSGCVEVGMNRELTTDEAWLDAWSVEVPAIAGVKPVTSVDYWGHYPVADLRYNSDCPAKVSVRAWAPFIPGDSAASNVPAAVFEVRVHNPTPEHQNVTIGASFPGPAGPGFAPRRFVREQCASEADGLAGVRVASVDGAMGYALSTPDGPARTGAGLHLAPDSWSAMSSTLPEGAQDADGSTDDPSASLCMDLDLPPNSVRTVRYFLTWFAPYWEGGSYEDILGFEEKLGMGPYAPANRSVREGKKYVAMYADRFSDAWDVARHVARNHESWLTRVLGWQAAMYSSAELPDWLQDTLVNSLALLTEDSYWARADEDLSPWADRSGAFGLVESPRGCAVMGCVVSNWYGDLPLLYFFPELERAVLDNYSAFMREDGAAAFLYPNGDWTRPTYEWLLPLNGFCFVDLVDRLWRRVDDDAVLDAFYDAVKKTTIFIMQLTGEPSSVVSVHQKGSGQEWWEFTPVKGIVPHVAGLRLAQLQMVKRMADHRGDTEFARQCAEWFKLGQELLERDLWLGETYRFYLDPSDGSTSEDVLSSQLDGDWASFAHGFGGVFQRDRAQTALSTISQICQTEFGVAGFVDREGGALDDPEASHSLHSERLQHESPGNKDAYGSFTAETVLVGLTFMYHGRRELGADIVRRSFDNLIRRQGHGWDLPNMIECRTGRRNFGTDYFQNLMIWAMPAALANADLWGPCATGNLVDRVLAGGRGDG